MNNFICSFLFLCFTIGFVSAQTTKFEAPANIYNGPYLEFTDDGFNLYTWYKRAGFMSKKTGIISGGNEVVKVNVLEIQNFDAAGKLLNKEEHPVRLEDENGLFSKYQVFDKSITGSKRKMFASGDDLSYEEILKKFPNSRSHTGGGEGNSQYRKYTEVEVRGKGLFGKSPFTLKTRKSGDRTTEKTVLKDFDTNDKLSEWRIVDAMIQTYVEEENELVAPAFYQKWVKKSRFNVYKEYKLVGYDGKGNVISQKDFSFDVPNQLKNTVPVYDLEGKRNGQIYVFAEMFGLGWKKQNPEPDKELNTLIWMNAKGEISEKIELRATSKPDYPSSPKILGAFQSNDGLRLFLPLPSSKRENRSDAILEEYVMQDGKFKRTDSSKLKPMIKNTNGEESLKFMWKTNLFFDRISLDEGVLYVGNTSYKADSERYYNNCYYTIVSPDGSVKRIGSIDTGIADSGRRPGVTLEKTENGKVLMYIGFSTGSTAVLYDPSTEEFKTIVPKSKMTSVEIMRHNDSFYFTGYLDAEKTAWIIEEVKM